MSGRKTRRAAVALTAAALIEVPAASAMAQVGQSHPRFPPVKANGCDYTPTIKYGYPTNSGLSGPQKAIIDAAAASWTEATNLNGQSFLQTNLAQLVNGQLPPGTFEITLGNASGYAGTGCTPNFIVIDAATITNAVLPSVIAHEFGHAHGMSHSGVPDNVVTGTPLMATCRGDWTNPPNLTADDEAQALFRNGTGVVTANAGFEDGLKYWTTSGTSLISGTGHSGAKYASLNANNSTIEQRHIVETEGEIKDYRLRFYFKMASGTSGGINYKFYRTPRTYPTSVSPNSCVYQGFNNHHDFNSPSIGTEYLISNQTTTNSTAWNPAASTSNPFGAFDGYEMRIKVTNGTNGPAYVDEFMAQAL